ncbi:MAG TPA: helix-turn-helix domain-containing protein [Steroidobacteraceae bacterium]|nr:helix-turn-helix domain-containing protein [Steroidobacteraceae bacterium]
MDMPVLSARLSPLVKSIWSIAGDAAQATLPGVVAPDSHIEFVFHLGTPWRMRIANQQRWTSQPHAFIYAQRKGALRFEGEGPVSVVAFRVSPLVATRILKRSLEQHWDLAVPLHEFIGAEAEQMLAALSVRSSSEREVYLQAWISSRLADWDSEDWATERLLEHLMWHMTSVSVEEAAARLGWSTRSLRRHAEKHSSLSPKEVQLAGRHLRACALLREAPSLDITEIAGRVGFFDHAAFSHSFRERTGMTPSEFRRQDYAFYERHA